MNRTTLTCLLAGMWIGLSWSLGCQGRASGPEYRIEVQGGPLQPGTEGKVSLRFVPREGYHWNEEFPARLKVQEVRGLQPLQEAFSSADADFQTREGVGVLDLPVRAEQAGASQVKAIADFSICNAQECRIFKQVPVEVSVDVR